MKNDPNPTPEPAQFLPAHEAFFEPTDASLLSPEEQMSWFLLWLKVHDAGHQPC